MQKFLTDVHNHSTFSFDGVDTLVDMLKEAQKLGIAFYGVSEHFDLEVCAQALAERPQSIDEEAYFHTARHLQEDYAGVMNVLVGAEFGYGTEIDVHTRYKMTHEKYHPDFVINSVHCLRGWDYATKKAFYKLGDDGALVLREKSAVYEEYLSLVRKSLDAPYPYDVVGHLCYASRYAPYEDKRILYTEYASQIDDILLTIIQNDKILEANASTYGLTQITLPGEDILTRYFQLGGRKISYASDAHQAQNLQRGREETVALLKKIGFTYLTVPCRGEHIKVEL